MNCAVRTVSECVLLRRSRREKEPSGPVKTGTWSISRAAPITGWPPTSRTRAWSSMAPIAACDVVSRMCGVREAMALASAV